MANSEVTDHVLLMQFQQKLVYYTFTAQKMWTNANAKNPQSENALYVSKQASWKESEGKANTFYLVREEI